MAQRVFKIAIICTEMLPVPLVRGGAVQILIHGVTPYLGKKHQLTIYSIQAGNLAEYGVVDGIEYIRVPEDDYPYRVGRELAVRRKAKERYDVIHVFNRPRDVLIYKSAMPESLAYTSEFPLTQDQLQVLYIDLLFPHQFHGECKNVFAKGKPGELKKVLRGYQEETGKLHVLNTLLKGGDGV